MTQRLDGRIDPARIGAPGTAPGDVLVWDGMRWVAGEVAAPVHVGTAEPASYTTGTLWYDTDATC